MMLVVFLVDWEQRKFEDILVPFSIKSKVENEYPVLSSTNGGMEFRSGRVSGASNKGYKIIGNGDLVLSPQNLWLGNININNIGKGLVSPSYKTFKFKNINPEFVAPQLKIGRKLKEYKDSSTQGASVVRRNLEMNYFYEITLLVPNIEEQNRIGELIKKLEIAITLHQRITSYVEWAFHSAFFFIEKVMYDWEQRKLGDEFVKVNERNNGQFAKDKWISVAKMYFQSVDKVQSNNIDTRTYVMRMGDIAFEGHPNKDFRFGRFVANDIGDGVVSELFPIYRHIGKYDLEYWKYAIHLERIMGPILSKSITSSGNSSNKINEHHFLKHRINVPNLNEQRKIGHLLKELEIALTLHQRIVPP